MHFDLPTAADLRAVRKRLDLTQARLAEEAGVSQSLIARIEGGSVDPRYSTVRRIVLALERLQGEQVLARDVMNRGVAAVRPDDPLTHAVDLLREHGFSQVPVLEDGHPVGALTESEVVRALARAPDEGIEAATVAQAMRAPFPAIEPSGSLAEVHRLLEDHAAVVVMEGGEVQGIITRADLLGRRARTP